MAQGERCVARTFLANPGKAVIVLAALALAACSSESSEPDATVEEQGRAIAVSYIAAASHHVTDTETSIATLHARSAPRIAAEVEGTLVEILVEEGQEVEREEALAILDRTDYEIQFRRAEAEMRRFRIQVDQKERDLRRQRRLREEGHISQLILEDAEAEYDAASQELAAARADFETAERRLARTRIVAPYAGVISERLASEGDYVDAGTPVFGLTTNGQFQVRIPIPDSVADRLAVGQEVRLWHNNRPEEIHAGRLDQISPRVDSQSRAVTAIAEISDAPEGWRAGTSINAQVVLEARVNVVVPPASIVRRPAGTVAYVLDGDIARERVVTTGRRTGEWVEILEGLRPGERVVVDGAGFLTDATPVTAEPSDRTLDLSSVAAVAGQGI